IFYPELKFVIAILGAILALLGICDVRKIFKTYSSLFLFLFYGVLFFTSIISYIIYGNLNGVYFSLSILFKFLIVIIFVMSLKDIDILFLIKILINIMAVVCLFSLIGEFLYILNIIAVTNSFEFQTYLYHVISYWGAFTVSFDIYGMKIIRNQSFFQEPGFFAFYIFITMIFISIVQKLYSKNHFFILYGLFFLTMLSTLSLTGIALSAILSVYIFRGVVINSIASIISMSILTYILISDNPYVNKIGSLDERLYGLINGANVFYSNPMVFLLGAGYESEPLFMFDGKFNNLFFEILLYSGIFNLFIYMGFIIYIFRKCYGIKFKYFLVIIYCMTTPLFWSPIMIIFNVVLLRYNGVKQSLLRLNEK
ncbi:O43 family O-antigen polymerase, partial [Escherichia coli]